MSKHTQGRWEIVPIECVGAGESLGRADIVVWDDDREGYEVIFHAVDFDDERSKANACMATAASDMFAALEGMINAIECDDLVARDESIGSDEGDHVYHVTRQAKAAIAKARGEA